MGGASTGADASGVRSEVARVAAGFAADRSARQQRRHLERADFDELARAGFLLTGVPREQGGLWSSPAESTRDVCEILRALARGDASVALVSSMHPAVLSFWLTTPEVPEPYRTAWAEQRATVFGAALDGEWWGTITSEPGSGGDVTRSKALARPDGDGGYLLSGAKHFGSGSGITSNMLTTAGPEGEEQPDWFYVPVAGVPWDGSAGVELVGEWDGHGMAATQSHAMRFDSCPAVRFAWPGHLEEIIAATAPVVGALFTAVVTGVVEVAVESARAYLEPRAESLRAYEQVEWAQAEMEGWLAVQAYEGLLRAIETGAPARGAVVRGKTAAAQLAESALRRICRVIGGGTFSQRSPFGWWFEDVRALGFLRPPWGLAFDGLFLESFTPPPS
ncbi:MAG TPA: acyl-CoA dehydrogenase family protein [Acidimicrobiia bacterium]